MKMMKMKFNRYRLDYAKRASEQTTTPTNATEAAPRTRQDSRVGVVHTALLCSALDRQIDIWMDGRSVDSRQANVSDILQDIHINYKKQPTTAHTHTNQMRTVKANCNSMIVISRPQNSDSDDSVQCLPFPPSLPSK